MRQRARELGITGWVRNCADGSVEALVHGSPQALDALTNWARRGPRGCRVDKVYVAPADVPENAPENFEVGPSV